MTEEFYSIRLASSILRVSMQRVHQLLESGELEGHKDATGRWQIPQRSVFAVLANTTLLAAAEDSSSSLPVSSIH